MGLWLAIDAANEAEKIQPIDAGWLVGSVEGLASAGKLDEARKRVEDHLSDPLDKLRGQARIAMVALNANPKETADLQVAVKPAQSIPDRLNLREAGRADTSWLLLRLAQAAARAGQVEAANQLADLIPEPALKGAANWRRSKPSWVPAPPTRCWRTPSPPISRRMRWPAS